VFDPEARLSIRFLHSPERPVCGNDCKVMYVGLWPAGAAGGAIAVNRLVATRFCLSRTTAIGKRNQGVYLFRIKGDFANPLESAIACRDAQ
jgi:hypothetical protein